MMALKRWHISKFPGKKHFIWVKAIKNWMLPTHLIIFPHYWAKILEITRRVNYSYLHPWHILFHYLLNDPHKGHWEVICSSRGHLTWRSLTPNGQDKYKWSLNWDHTLMDFYETCTKEFWGRGLESGHTCGPNYFLDARLIMSWGGGGLILHIV